MSERSGGGVEKDEKYTSHNGTNTIPLNYIRLARSAQQITSSSPSEMGEKRLKYFKDVVLPQLVKINQHHTLIYVPNYFEFVALRNLLLKQELNFVR